jgi:hypothetical protein
MEYLVTGIAPTSDTARIEQQLAQAVPLEAARLAVVTKANHSALAEHDEGFGSRLSTTSTISTGSGGTGVPGIGRSGPSLGSLVGHGDFVNCLGDLPLIPPDQAEHFNIAIAEGRGLVTYKASPEEASRVEAAFRAAGLRNVKVFKPKENHG